MAAWVSSWSVVMLFYVSGEYVTYENNRMCAPYINCGPGKEIIPCENDFEHDTCESCDDGMVQPEILSSTGNRSATACFKPTSECLAEDIIDRRNPSDAFCKEMSGCKCKTQDCFYGDPCLCSVKDDGCGMGKELNDIGECVDCEEGYEKHDTGCGPCLKNPRFKKVQNIKSLTTTGEHNNFTSFTTRPLHLSSIPIVVSESVIQETQRKPTNKILIIFMVILSVVVLLLGIILIVLLTRRPSCVTWGSIWANNVHNTTNFERNQNDIPVLQQLALQPATNGNNLQNEDTEQAQTEYNKLIKPTDLMNTERCKNNSNYRACHAHSSKLDLEKPMTHQSCKKMIEYKDFNSQRQDMSSTLDDPNDIERIEGRKLIEDIVEALPDCSRRESKNKNIIRSEPGLDILRHNDDIDLEKRKGPVVNDTQPHYLDSRIMFAETMNASYDETVSGSYITMNTPAHRIQINRSEVQFKHKNDEGALIIGDDLPKPYVTGLYCKPVQNDLKTRRQLNSSNSYSSTCAEDSGIITY